MEDSGANEIKFCLQGVKTMSMLADVGSVTAAKDILETVLQEKKNMDPDSAQNQTAISSLNRVEQKCREIISAAESGWY